jgi:hypothetical protein
MGHSKEITETIGFKAFPCTGNEAIGHPSWLKTVSTHTMVVRSDLISAFLGEFFR